MVEPFGEGEKAEKFGYSLFLVLCNRLSSCTIALVMLLVRRSPQHLASPLSGLTRRY